MAQDQQPNQGQFDVYPVRRSFLQAGQVARLPNGLIVGHYERAGEIKIGDTSVGSPSEREMARRERMKREAEVGK